MTDPAAIPLDHGAIGNGRVLALVAPTTRIDWLCLPRFDRRLVREAMENQYTFSHALCWVNAYRGAITARCFVRETLAAEWETWAAGYQQVILDRHKDDFGDTTSAFSICSFWWAEALAMIGRIEQATALFYRLPGCANRVGLFSEDIDPHTDRLLGNFPQAYTHVGLIHTAVPLGEPIEARDGSFRAWS